MRRLALTTFFLLLGAACGGELGEAQPAPPHPGELLGLVRTNRQAMHAQMASYLQSSRNLCFRVILASPETPQAREAGEFLLEFQEMGRLIAVDTDPTLGLQANAATKMWTQAQQYAEMDTPGSLRSAEFIYREIIRRYPDTRQAVDAALRITQLAGTLSVINLWERLEREAARNDREGLVAAESLCRDIIRLYPESPYAGEAARKLVEVSVALKNLPAGEERHESGGSSGREVMETGGRAAFSFEGEPGGDWQLPNPDELYRQPEKRTESLQPLPRSAVLPADADLRE